MPRKQTPPKKRYPDPYCEYDLFDLGALPDPPDDWTLYGYGKETFGGTSRIFSSAVTKDLVDFHCWGIEPDIQGRSKKESRLMALRKLSYYQADQHRPPTLNDFLDFSRDAGPRLLRTDLNPMPKPISRFYPTVPDTGTNPAGDGIPPSYAQQFAYPSGPRSKSTTPSRSPSTSIPPSLSPSGRGAMNPPSVLKPHSTAVPGQSLPVPAVVESVERALVGLRYRLLDRHPQAAANTPQPYLTATNERDLLRVETRSFALTSHVRLSRSRDGSDFVLDPNGLIYAFRGRGPVSGVNTSAIDCVIVAGKFLDAGSTIIDRAGEILGNTLTEVERGFRTMVDTDWAVLSPERSMATRDILRDIIIRNVDSAIGPAVPVSNIWDACTQSFGQFHVSYTERLVECPSCLRSFTPESTRVVTSTVAPSHFESDAQSVTMEALLSRFFTHRLSQNCVYCGKKDGIVRERKFGGLPMRMVVRLHQSASPRNHTSANIKVRYCDEHGQARVATYRWLGGIYCNKNETHSHLGGEDPYRYRIYWTDSERGEKETGEIRMYDGRKNLGLIVGTIPASHQDEPIPEAWCRGVPIPLLFYEQVLNPNRDDLEVAMQTVEDMVYAADNDVLILQKHQPWASGDRRRDSEARSSPNVKVEEEYDNLGGSSSFAVPQEGMNRNDGPVDSMGVSGRNTQLNPNQASEDVDMGDPNMTEPLQLFMGSLSCPGRWG
ncbi:hypothetical protein VTN77DRAFT_4739 [Rasamsonia byssochlamydoides]|uniref:uncharacterized protein n=1 Tax=Rasamsonia byssochlamydoides TaxID=89139 RepID=UPI0037435B35